MEDGKNVKEIAEKVTGSKSGIDIDGGSVVEGVLDAAGEAVSAVASAVIDAIFDS